MARVEAERDAARHDAQMARMDADAAGSARAKVESELARVQNALAVVEEARRKAECKTHPCFEFISHAILRILYPYSCKTHNISSKLGFVGLLMKSK